MTTRRMFTAGAAGLAALAPGAGAQALEKPRLTIGVGGKPLLYYLDCCRFGGHRDKVFQPYRRFPCSDECSAGSLSLRR